MIESENWRQLSQPSTWKLKPIATGSLAFPTPQALHQFLTDISFVVVFWADPFFCLVVVITLVFCRSKLNFEVSLSRLLTDQSTFVTFFTIITPGLHHSSWRCAALWTQTSKSCRLQEGLFTMSFLLKLCHSLKYCGGFVRSKTEVKENLSLILHLNTSGCIFIKNFTRVSFSNTSFKKAFWVFKLFLWSYVGFQGPEFRKFLLTKLINAELAAYNSAEFAKLAVSVKP